MQNNDSVNKYNLLPTIMDIFHHKSSADVFTTDDMYDTGEQDPDPAT